jgi:uncharacterized protein YbbC (DUF1343 family)
MYRDFPDKTHFFSHADFFDKLAGTKDLRNQILSGKSEAEIRESWSGRLNDYKLLRENYLLY